jgi:hypothetical protein
MEGAILHADNREPSRHPRHGDPGGVKGGKSVVTYYSLSAALA